MGEKPEIELDPVASASESRVEELVSPMVPLVREAEMEGNAANRITPYRTITRPTHTAEYLVSEADLTHIENSDGGLLYNFAIFFLGGALSLLPQSVSIGAKWWSQTGPALYELLDVANIIVFLVCMIVGASFLLVSPRPNQKLKQITKDIRDRPTVDTE